MPVIIQEASIMDAVAIGSVVAVVGAIIVFVVLVVRISRLINSSHSEDK